MADEKLYVYDITDEPPGTLETREVDGAEEAHVQLRGKAEVIR